MNRAMLLAAMTFSCALHFADRIIAGFVQCGAAQTCPWESR